MPRPHAAWLGSLVVLAAATLFATLGVLSRTAYAVGVAPVAFVAWRSGIGTLGLALAIVAVRGPRGALAPLRAAPSVRRWLLLAVLMGAGLNLAIFLAFDRTTVALALLGFYTYPAMVAVGSVLLGRERLDSARVMALALALAGMVAVVLGGQASSQPVRLDALGIGLALAAAGFQTVFVLASRGYASMPTDVAMATILAGSAIVAVLVTLVSAGADALLMPLRAPELLVLLVLIGVFAAAVPSFLFLTGIRAIGGVRTGILMLFEPVVGVGLAAVFLAEGFAPLQALGGATILLAAFIVQRGTARPAGRSAESTAVSPIPGGP
jgi:drug/metabolite transporter (DMT)-like permease